MIKIFQLQNIIGYKELSNYKLWTFMHLHEI